MLLLATNVHEKTSQKVKTDVNFGSARAFCNLHSRCNFVLIFNQSDALNFFMCIISIGNHMISSAICGLWNNLQVPSAYLFQIAREKSCDYALTIYMKKYEIAHHSCAEAKRSSSAKIIYSNPASDIVRSVQTATYDQSNNIQWYFHIFKAQKS